MIQKSFHMRYFIPLLVAVLLLLDVEVRPASALGISSGDTPACIADDAFSTAFRDWVVGVANGGDSTVAYRNELGIPVLADSAIVFVADSALCDVAARQHALAAGEDTLAPLPVHLLRLGTYRYVAFNGLRAGEFHVYFVFDQSFTLKTSYMM
jgi:hypothetical protein